jgi:hypothetical protein
MEQDKKSLFAGAEGTGQGGKLGATRQGRAHNGNRWSRAFQAARSTSRTPLTVGSQIRDLLRQEREDHL